MLFHAATSKACLCKFSTLSSFYKDGL
jgi:hypothetical protein